MGFTELNRRLSNISQSTIVEWVEDILNELDGEIEDLNREQLGEGMYATGGFLRNYSYATTEISPHKTGRIKLYDEGDFWRSIFASSGMGILEIDATDWKTDMLKEEFGNEILGLAPTQFNYIIQKVAEKLKVKFGEYLKQ